MILKFFLILSLLFVSLFADYNWQKKNKLKGKDFGAYGQLYDIEEFNLIDEIKDKYSKIDWDKQKKSFEESAKEIMIAKGNLPLCQTTEKRKVYLYNTLKYPIYGPNKEIIYPIGYKFNVLKVLAERGMVDQRKMLFFNMNEPRQVQLAKKMKNEHMYLTDGSLEDAAKAGIIEPYRADGLIKKLQIKCTPSIYVQKEDHYEVYEIDNETLKNKIINKKDGDFN